MVRAEGLEPPHLSTTGPKPAASTNSATRADAVGGAAYNRDDRMGNPMRASNRLFRGAFRVHAGTARTQRAADDALALTAGAVPARPADRAAARHPDTFPRYRRALSALARNSAIARTDLARGLRAAAPIVFPRKVGNNPSF